MAYRIKVISSKDGESTFVARVPQYVQCEQGNHLTSEKKEVETWSIKADAHRELANIVSSNLMMYNVKVLSARIGWAKIAYTYSNGDETVVYSVDNV